MFSRCRLPLLANLSRSQEWFRERFHYPLPEGAGSAPGGKGVQEASLATDAPKYSGDDEDQCVRVSGVSCEELMTVPIVPPPCAAVAHLARRVEEASVLKARVLPLLHAAMPALQVTCVAAERPTTQIPFNGYPSSSRGRHCRYNANSSTIFDYGYVDAARSRAAPLSGKKPCRSTDEEESAHRQGGGASSS